MAQMKEAFCKAKSIPIEKKRTFGILLFIKVAGIANHLALFRISSKRAGIAHSPASFRSRGALFRAATSESRRFSAEKRRLMFAPNRFIRDLAQKIRLCTI
jgi:hypothetical protein